MDSNSYEALVQRRQAATLQWRGPALMLFARSILLPLAIAHALMDGTSVLLPLLGK